MNITSLVAVWVFLLSPPEVGWTSYGGEATLPLTVAEPHLQRAIDEYVYSEMGNQRIAGLSLAVVHAGKLVQAKGYGKRIRMGILLLPRRAHEQRETLPFPGKELPR